MLCVAVQVTTRRGRGHSVAAPLQAVQLVFLSLLGTDRHELKARI